MRSARSATRCTEIMKNVAIVLVILAVIAGGAWYFSRNDAQAPSVANNQKTDTCGVISGKKFLSIDRQAVGLTPSGPAEGYFFINFGENGRVSWNYGDALGGGDFRCEGNEIIARNGNYTEEGAYDPLTGVLTWEGLRYRAVVE